MEKEERKVDPRKIKAAKAAKAVARATRAIKAQSVGGADDMDILQRNAKQSLMNFAQIVRKRTRVRAVRVLKSN